MEGRPGIPLDYEPPPRLTWRDRFYKTWGIKLWPTWQLIVGVLAVVTLIIIWLYLNSRFPE